MSCVNKSSEEFKDLASKHGISANALELITHKYWLETGSEENFPTDVYIQAQLGNNSYQENITSVRKLWDESYSSPKEYNSFEEVDKAYNEALKYFPKGAVVYYKNDKGRYILSVRKPVEKTPATAYDFFNDEYNSAKKLNLQINEGENYTIDKVEELFNKFNTDRTSQFLADKVFKLAKDLGLQISFNSSLPAAGRYTNNNTIVYNKRYFEADLNNDRKPDILLHEVIHAITMYALSDQTSNWSRNKDLEDFRNTVNDIYGKVRYNDALKGEQGIKDIKEFVAELGNPVFRRKLQSIDNRSFWQKLVDAVKNLLGIHTSSTYYGRMMNTLDKAINAFDIDSYMKYNGMKQSLQRGYNDHRAETKDMTETELKSTVKNAITDSAPKISGEEIINTRIKPQYRGKLIYAQSGTGKSTIADNINVFDSDYLLGQVLGVSTETAGFFFKQLSAKQKKAFGEQYRNLIREKVAEGKTVLTANNSMLPNADVVVYNQSAEQTDERVNRGDRAITNRYSALDYHRDTLEQINQLKAKDESKEYIELGKEDYLGNHILSNNSSTDNSASSQRNVQRRALEGETGLDKSGRLTSKKVVDDFLDKFGITVNHIDDYNGDLPLFDALNRVINAKTADDITDGVGYAIAFMMQSDPEMMHIMNLAHHLDAMDDKELTPNWVRQIIPNFNLGGKKYVPSIIRGVTGYRLRHLTPAMAKRYYLYRDDVFKEVGKQIAKELKKHFGEDYANVKTNKENHSIWTIIKNFFHNLGKKILLNHSKKLEDEKNVFVKDIVEALGREDFSRIQGPRVKPGTDKMASRVDIEKALRENPFEENIIRKLGENGISLAGSASIALEGSLYRPSENPLHDIDFSAGDKSSKAKLDKLLPKIFGKDQIHFASIIPDEKGKGNDTVTYVMLDRPFTVKKEGKNDTYYDLDGNYLGKRTSYSDLELVDGVKGKMLDFFVGPNKASEYGVHTETLNGNKYLISNSNAAMAAKILWARPKDMYDYKNFVPNKVSVLSDADRSALSYIDTMSKDELSKEVGLIKQEYSDYDILNAMRGIEPSKKGKHTFTFNDGTTVNVPFKPNEQQAHALNVMDEFIKSDETSMTLSGYAGTGKTSLMEILAKKATKDGVRIKFSASTNKAAAVLKSKVSKIGYTADTLNKVFGISVEVDSSKPYDAKNLVTKLKEAQVWWGTTVIIDEASMINEENYKRLTDIAKENGLKIIFVGDKAQLAPVKENKISPVFRSTNTKCVELTKVERTDDNAILKEATNLRNNQPLSMESSFNNEGKGVAFTKDNQTASDVIKYYVGQIKNNPDSFKILAYTNAAVANYNERVRHLLGYRGETPNVGEPMMGYANWGYDYRIKTYQFINSEAYTVTKVDAPKQVSFSIQGNNIKLTIIPITLKDSLGESRIFNYIDIKGNAANRETVAFLGALKNKLWAKAMSVSKYARIPYYKAINQIDKYLFVNDDIKEGGRTLVAKVIDFGYAMTVHKSQGSTFTNVLMDENDISKARNAVEESFNPVATVDLGNAGHEVTSDDHLDSVDEIDLGEDFSNVKQKPTNTDTANMFQQLNYVAMSRATNTVTVLTDGAKKEDSPLNHIKEKGAEKPIQETQRPVAPITPEKPREYYTGNITPDAETIFVFGSNPEGRHGAGAAKIAHDEFGAQYGVGEGLTGNAYALPTKDLRVKENKGLKSISPERITESIKKMYAVARQHPDKLFKVAYRNTSNASLNGYTGYEMIDMFNKAGKVPSNVQFSEEWYKTGLLKPIETTQSTTSNDRFIVNESVFGDKDAVIDRTTIITKDIAQAMALYKSGKIGVKEFIKRIHPTNTWMHEHAGKNYADKFVNQHGWVLSENNVNTPITETSSDNNEEKEIKADKLTDETLDKISKGFKNFKNEKDIRGVDFSEETLNVRVKTLDNNIDCVIYYDDDKNEFRTHIELSPEANPDYNIDAHTNPYLSKEKQKKIIDHYIPKELQEYFTSGQYRKDHDYDTLVTQERANSKFSIMSSDEKLQWITDNSRVNNYLYNNYGITWYNPYTGMYYHPTYSLNNTENLQWSRYSDNGYEVSSAGDNRFSALKATFKDGAKWQGQDISGKTIEDVYQHIVKKSSKGQAPAKDSILYNEALKTKADREDYSYEKGYLPLWKIWAEQHSEEIEDLRQKSQGKVLTDKFASTRVSQARALADILNSTSNQSNIKSEPLTFYSGGAKGNDTYNSILNITQNASGRLGSLDKTDENSFNSAKETLRKADATPKEIEEATKTLNDIYERKNKEIQTIFKDVSDLTGAKFSIVEAAGSWQGGGEYSFKIKVEAPTKEAYDNTMLAVSYVAEAARQDAFVENLGEADRKDVNQNSLLEGQQTPNITIPFSHSLSEREMALVQGTFLENSTDELPLDATITKDEISFNLPAWVLKDTDENGEKKDNATRYKEYKELYDKWNNKIIEIFNNNKDGRLKGIYRQEAKRTYQKNRLQGCDPYGEGEKTRTYNDYRNNLLSGQRRNGTDASQSKGVGRQTTLTDEEGQVIKANAEKLFGLEENNTQPTIEGIPPTDGTPSTSHTLSLPGYEYFNDLYEDIIVDASWKDDLLKELDSQLSPNNTTEQNNEIINKMNDILKASTEDDLKGEQSSKKQAEIQHDLDEYDKLNKQFDNLLEGNFADKENGNIKDLDIKFKASEIRYVAELVGNYLSDIITKLQTEPNAASELFNELQFDRRVDFTTMTRREIASTIGINNIIARAKYDFAPENGVLPYDNVDTLAKAQLVEENWDALMLLASDVFALNEGFSIKRDYEHSNFAINDENNQIAYDDFNGYQDEDSTNETEGDSQEKWQIDFRTIDTLNSMSALVRQRLHNCFILDENGKVQVDKDWKLPLRVNPRKSTNSILRWVQGSTSLDDMVNKLDAKQKDNPWVQQLVQSLSDKTGKETDFQSQFYGVFCKHFQPYSIVLLDKGKYGSIPVNNHPALTEAMNSIIATYRMGEHPLFNINGKINESLLGNENTTNEKADFNLNQAFANLKTIVARLNHKEEFDADMSKEATKWITGVYRVLGYYVTEDMVSDILDADKVRYLTDKLRYIVDDLGRALKQQKKNVGNPKAKEYQPFTYGAEYNVRGSISNFLSPITESLEDTAISAFYDSGKMYQSYVTPSFMTKLMIKFKNLKGKDFEDFIMNEYGNSAWFRDPKGGLIIGKGWKNEMLRLLATDENARNIFDFKVELNFNKHNYMRNMNDSEYTLSLITEYFSESSETNNLTPAYFRMPMQSNKPSSEFFKFYSYRGSEYKNAIVRNLYTMFLQELGRIQTVRMRNLSKDDPRFIKNFDSNGRKFNFLPFLNTYLEDTNTSARTLLRDEDGRVSTDNERLAKLLQRKVEGLEETKLSAEEETELKSLVTKAIRNYMEARANEILDRWESSGIVEAARNIKNIVPHEDLLKTDEDENKNEYVRQSLENYIWNDYLATKNILQLTVGDTAFNKDAEDLQKRLAQLHSPGIRGNINATDYEGHRVSDGKYRTLILRDFDNFISSIIGNISEVFDRKIERAPENQKNQWRALKESLVGEHGEYRKINVTDAQGYSSPSSYRKKAFIFGKWSRHAEDIYQKLLKGEYTFSDLKTAFQPLKPFVYTHLEKNLGVDKAPIHIMHVPFQAKNSEYLLIMADALIKGEQMKSGNLSRPNLLSAIYRVMEDSEKINPTKGIDTVQFESAIKSGLQGALDIHQFSDTKGGEDAAYTFMMNQVYKMDDKGQRTNEYNTDTFVHEASYDDYCLQQEVPEHFKNHSQTHGSQIRAITPSDLDEYKDPNADHNDENNIVYYEWTEPDGTKRKVTASEFRKEYEDTIAANIEQDLNKLYEEFHLNSKDKRERNIALSKVLQKEILSSPRYGVDLLQACSVDKTTGEFRIPKGDPIQAKRIEQLINSIIKNRVNKQKIAGGPIVQVTNFGTSKQLHIRFNDRQGGLLKTEEEFNADDSLKKEYGNYSKYTKERQAGIAYFEVYIPMWSDELYNKFVDENGYIDVDAIEATSPELLKMISYRIPTEDKYSTAPMKAVGFMPREAGDAIMLPYELTTIDDSDFDVDKRYVMRKDLQIVSKPKGQIFKEMFNKVVESYKSSHDGKIDSDHKTAFRDLINTFIDDKNRGKYKGTVINFMGHPVKADSIMNYLNSIYRKVAYTVKMPTDRQYRNNKIIDMTWAVLTNEMTADKILNPGGFEKVAKTGYKIAAYKAVGKEGKSWDSLQGMTEDELKDLSYTSKDLSWVDTQIQFYKQNSATSSMIGIFAVNKVAHAILESDDIYIDVNEICGKEPFTIADTTFDGRMRIDSKLDSEGNLIGKTEGSLVSASADGVKKPVLDLMNVNTTTANVLNTLLRMGMPFDDAALFMSQDSITRLLREYNNRSLTNYVSLQSVISEFMDKFDKENHITDDSNIKTEELSRQELIEGLLDTDHKVIDYKVMLALQKLLALGQALRNPTFATRFNSISSAVGPLIIDNLIMQHKIDQFNDSATEDGTHFYDKNGFNVDIDDVFYNHPILKQFSKTLDVANELFKDMPAGSEQFKNVLDNLPEYISDKIYNDKKLLSQLSDFYQSYLLVASGLVDSSQLKDIINNFPKEFNDKNYKEKYKDNELIQAIKLNVSRKTNRPYLEIKTTGMDAPDKEALSSAWIDLHREDPELSKKLFIYNFFRGGIGFSPKTFMSLVPMFIKEHMNTTKADGSTISYLDTFRNMPDVNPEIVIDQFVRNNWDNNKLVPWKGGKGTKYVFDYKNGLLTVNKSDLSGLEGAKYIKTKGKDRTNLWRLISSDENGAKYQLIKPLGDNNEYIEMSTSEIDKPISETLNVEEDNNPSSLSEKGSTEDSTDKVKDVKTDKDNEYSMSNLADLIMKQNSRFDKNEAVDKIEDIKKDIKSYRKFLINVFKHKGLNLNENQAMEEFNKYC